MIDFNWKRKKNRKLKMVSRTPGSQKGERCQAKPLQRYMAKKSRSYKHHSYRTWCEEMNKRNS